MNSFSCVITGHRPTRFKFKYNEKDKRCQRIKKCLQEQLIRLYNQGVRCFWAGGAMGADMWAAEILLRMKEQTAYQDVELCLALPFEGYDADWDDWHQKRMKFIRKLVDCLEKCLIYGHIRRFANRFYYSFTTFNGLSLDMQKAPAGCRIDRYTTLRGTSKRKNKITPPIRRRFSLLHWRTGTLLFYALMLRSKGK